MNNITYKIGDEVCFFNDDYIEKGHLYIISLNGGPSNFNEVDDTMVNDNKFSFYLYRKGSPELIHTDKIFKASSSYVKKYNKEVCMGKLKNNLAWES